MPVTIKDIAKRTGLSASTVSRALNNSRLVKQSTKKKVWSIAKELDYRSSAIARSLVRNKTETLGLVVPSARKFENTVFTLILEGVAEEAKSIGYSLIFSAVGDDSHMSDVAITKLEEQRVDGYILMWLKDRHVSSSQLAELAKKGPPFILIADRVLEPGINLVACNNELGGYKATRHLIDLEHTRIAMISNSENPMISKRRHDGYRLALKEAGLWCLDELYHPARFSQRGSGQAAMSSLLDSGIQFTAVFVYCDILAAEAIKAVHAQGLRVPEDIAVVGYDGAEFGEALTPAITTIKQPSYEIGKQAVQMLKKVLDGEELWDNQRWIEPELVIRASCGYKARSGYMATPLNNREVILQKKIK